MIAQMTLRQIPDEVEKKLRARSKQSRKSMNRTAIELLEEALELRFPAGKKRDLSVLAGAWEQDEHMAFESNTALFGKIDEELWPQ